MPIPEFFRSEPSRTDFGSLTFLGGLFLSSPAAEFGGFSGLRLSADGTRLIAVSDRGSWLQGRLIHDGTRLTGVDDADLSPVLGPDGEKLPASHSDMESLEVSGEQAWISLERVHEVLRFDIGEGLASARAASFAMPKAVSRLSGNAAIEAIGLVPDGQNGAGRLLLIGEEARVRDDDHPAWLVAPDGTGKAETLGIRSRDGYAVTDLAFLPGNGDLVILERRYRPPFSLNVRLRRIAANALVSGAVLDGDILFQAGLGQEIDNLEALSIHRSDDGRTILTMLSDDNFNPLQRTVLLEFALEE